jgi:GTP-binding protein
MPVPSVVLDEIYDLLIDLDANEKQLDFPLLYCVGRQGIAMKSPEDAGENFICCLT